MRTVSEDLKNAFLTGAQKILTLRFSDGTTLGREAVSQESMVLEQTLCDEDQLHFGLCNSSSFTVDIIASTKRYKGMFVYPTISVGNYSMTLGKYRIDSDKLTDDRMYRTLTCYDQMSDLMTDDVSGWYAGLNLPMSMLAFRNSLFSYFRNKYGVNHVQTELCNDDMTVERTIDSDQPIDGQVVLEKICEINGCFGTINPDGQFEYVELEPIPMLLPANDLYPADDLYPEGDIEYIGADTNNPDASFLQASLVWEEYNYQPITKLQIHQTTNDVGAIVGTDGNCYEVYDNFLVYGKDAQPLQTIAENLLGQMEKAISYTPAKVAVRGRPWVELGDLIFIKHKGKTLAFPMLRRTMSGITALKDEYQAKGQEKFTFNVTDTNHEIYGILRKTLEITKSVDGLEVKATELRADLTQFEADITITAQQIQSQVTANYNNQQVFNSSITQTATQIQTEVSQQGTDIENLSSRLTQTASSIEAEIVSETSRASIVAKINSGGGSAVQISADQIDLQGYVTFTNLSTSGQTTINGDNITTGTISSANGVTKMNLTDGDITVGSGDKRIHMKASDASFNVELRDTASSPWRSIASLHYEQDAQYNTYAALEVPKIELGSNSVISGLGGTFRVDSAGIALLADDGYNDWVSLVTLVDAFNEEAFFFNKENGSASIHCGDIHCGDVVPSGIVFGKGSATEQAGLTKTCWVKNSNDQPARLDFLHGVLVSTQGFD